MYKLVINMACFLMILGMASTVFATDDMTNNEIFSEEVIAESTITTENFEEQDAEKIIARKMNMERISLTETADENQAEKIDVQKVSGEETDATESNDEQPPEETIVEETDEMKKEETVAEKYVKLHTGVLTARKGYITDSPCGPNGNDGYETWYPTHPGGAVKILEKQCGFTNLKLEVCKEDGARKGVRILSGTMPNGETFENLVVVAADIICERNPTGVFERGQLIETSLGPGIIVDFCERAVNERKYNSRTHIDIATNWYN